MPAAIAALGLLFLTVFLLYPLFQVFGASLLNADGTSLTLANYAKILGRPFYRGAIVNTLSIGAAATVITALLTVPMAFALARLPVPGKAAILAMAALPLVLPSFVSAYAIVLLLGLVNMMRGGSGNTSQKLMRLRVLLQFVAIVIIMFTIWMMQK